MRKLAWFAAAYSAAVAGANFLLPERALPALGLGCLVLLLCCLAVKNRRRRRLYRILLSGAAVGFLWSAAYCQLFFQPARALDGQTVRLAGVVEEWAQETDYGYSVLVRAEAGGLAHPATLLYVDEQGKDLRPGDRITTVAYCTLADRTLAGEEITYYTAKGIFLRGEAYGTLTIERPEHVPFWYWPALWSKSLKEGVDAAFPADVAPLVRALVTGNRDNLTDPFTTSLQRTGLSHTVAVSGMHLALFAALVRLAVGRGSWRSALLVCLLVLLFCLVAGNTPSVVRAAIMVWMLQLAPLLGRERDSFTSLAFALLLLLVQNPFAAANVGLQLSFAAVAGILLVSDPIQNRLLAWLHLDHWSKHWLVRQTMRPPRFLVSVFSATLGASVLTVPLVAFHFGTFSLISPLSNLMTLWAVSILFPAGLLLGCLGTVLPGLAGVLAIPFTLLGRYLNWAVDLLGGLPMAAIPLDSFYYRAWVVYLCLLIGCALMMKGERRIILPVCGAVCALTLSVLLNALTFRSGQLRVSVLDVGQGQSVVVRSGDYVALVDCGGDGPESAGDVAADYLQAVGQTRLDLLVLSHFHDDHANGVEQLLERMEVEAIALPDVEEEAPLRLEILALAEEKGIPVHRIRADTSLTLPGGGTLTLYAPLGRGTDTNELGLTVLAGAGEFDVLIPGDMGGEVEQLLLQHASLPDLELLVAGHHGSAGSTTQTLLDALAPELAVISVGQNNIYGHPAQETLERLAGSGCEIYRTDLQGTVEVRAG